MALLSQYNNSRVCYFYDSELGSYYYGSGHPMKPHRLRMTHSLLLAYGLYKKMEVYRPHPAQQQEMERFHSADYIQFLKRVTPDSAKDYLHQLQKFNLGPYTDCFPEDDTRVLTDRGFLFLDEIEALQAAGQKPLFACYDAQASELRYAPGELIVKEAKQRKLVDITPADEQAAWAEGGSAMPAGSGLSLRVTERHQMFVQAGHQSVRGGEVEWSSAPFAKVHAEELARMKHGDSFATHHRHMAAAANGVAVEAGALQAQLARTLGLTSEQEVDAFMELYGFWLGAGSLSFQDASASSIDAVLFHPRAETDRVWLQSLRGAAGVAAEPCQPCAISDSRWVDFFHAEHAADGAMLPPRMAEWVLRSCSRAQLRVLFRGLLRAQGVSASEQCVNTISASFRDELVVALMHAGYSVHFTAQGESWCVSFVEAAEARPLVATADVRESVYTGRVWCVSVDHEDHLIVAQRAQREVKDGVVRQASRPIIVGNCPIFDGMYDFCSLYSGGSIDGAMKLNHGLVDIAVNWSGGLHHAKKSESSGFCYVNDIVLGILELLKYHARVLYIDIDIHHGDGVEEAFYTTDRVMTVSFHKFGDFFPGTGDLKDDGVEKGKYYSVNFPLNDGIDDKTYLSVFKPVIQKIMDVYRPGAVVLQCGADSLTGDRLGCFNLTVKGHGECVKFVKSFGLPTLVLGGGGYNIRNVSRCWTYETAVLLDTPVNSNIPNNDFIQYYGPEYKLHLTPSDMSNLNDPRDLEKTKIKLLQNLSLIEHAPSVQMQQVPPDFFLRDDRAADDAADPDVRISVAQRDKEVQKKGEFFDGDQDQDTSKQANPIVRNSDHVMMDDDTEQ